MILAWKGGPQVRLRQTSAPNLSVEALPLGLPELSCRPSVGPNTPGRSGDIPSTVPPGRRVLPSILLPDWKIVALAAGLRLGEFHTLVMDYFFLDDVEF